ncbi:outer membrane beta-barrel protein [Flavobacterium soyae]|uniref:Outer membrane beta-barrel protein n=1 Tax=Flavobacterium soyae TaxID=2903098 RepID=A0ABZ2UK58_9FLAO
MKKKLPVLLFILFSSSFYAQINYDKSYFIDNNGNKIECFIKDRDKKDNPTTFEYKLSTDESQLMKADIKNVKEFKIGNVLKYERERVKLDTSSTANLNSYNENREPQWKEVTVFLEVLVDSKVSLYEYKSGNIKRFFYKTESGNVEQLVHKKYTVNEDTGATKLVSNNDFQKQLWQNVNCGNKSIDDLLKLKYGQKDLTKYFIEYNNCKNNTIVSFEKKSESGSINFKANLGISSSSLSISNHVTDVSSDFDKKTNFTAGAEMEWVLPVNRSKWALYLAPNYNSYKSPGMGVSYNRGPFSSDTVIENWDASLSYIDIPVGVRYYIFISDNSRIFIAGSYIISSMLSSDIHQDQGTYQVEAKIRNRLGGGIGYSYKNKFNVELKYSSANIFDNYVYWDSSYKMTSFVLGYTIFDSKKKK